MDDVKIEIGYALPKERWNEAAENLMQAGLMVAKYFKREALREILDRWRDAHAESADCKV